MDYIEKLNPEEAVAAVRAGRTVRVTVGTGGGDPVLEVYAFEGMAMSNAVAGWSAGVVEPVCALGSDFLEDFMCRKVKLELVGTEGG